MPISNDDLVAWLNRQVYEGELAKAALALLQQPPLPAGQLSPHFTLAEMTNSATAAQNGIDNTPSSAIVDQLRVLCNVTLEGIRGICGNNPVLVSSGYRCPELNAAVGGVSNSAHLYGCAADFTIPAFGSVDKIFNTLKSRLVDLEIDQLINEGGGSWVHVGRAIPPSTQPRYQSFSA